MSNDKTSAMEMEEYAFAWLAIIRSVYSQRDLATLFSRGYLAVFGVFKVNWQRKWSLAILAHGPILGYSNIIPVRASSSDFLENDIELLDVVWHIIGEELGGIECEIAGECHFQRVEL